MQDQNSIQQSSVAVQRDSIRQNAVVLRKFAAPHMKELLQAVPAMDWAGERRFINLLGLIGYIGMPEVVTKLTRDAAAAAGFEGYDPDFWQVRHLLPWMGRTWRTEAHEEHISEGPTVSISLGMPATFLLAPRKDSKGIEVLMHHGDVAVWSGNDQLYYHGSAPFGDDDHPELGCLRINVTFLRRRAAQPAAITH